MKNPPVQEYTHDSGGRKKDIKKSQDSPPDFFSESDRSGKIDQTTNFSTSDYTEPERGLKDQNPPTKEKTQKKTQNKYDFLEDRAEKIPCSELHEHIRDVLRFCGSISQKKAEKPFADFKNRKRVDRREKYSVSRLSDNRILFTKAITVKGNNDTGNLKRIGISFNPNLANRRIGSVNLFLDYLMAQNLNQENKKDPYITFSLASLVKKGMYGRISDAKAAMIKTVIPILSDLMIHGITEKPEKLFLSFDIGKKGLLSVHLNPEIDWIHLYKNRWVYLPLGYYSLSPRASELCHYIGSWLRLKSQRDRIAKNLPCNLHIESICNHLYLPKDTKRLKQLVINPIRQDLEALTEVQKLFYAPQEAFEQDYEEAQKILDEMPAVCFEFILDSKEDSRTLLKTGAVSILVHDPITHFYMRIKKQADDNKRKGKNKSKK